MSSDVADSDTHRILGLKRRALDQINLLLSSGLASYKRPKNDDSLDEFRKRLATFHEGKWQNGKELNPRRLAERGWKLVDATKKTIKCDSCGFYLSTTLPDITLVDIKVYNRCLRNVHEGLETCHEKTCTAKSRRPNFFPHFNERCELVRELNSRLEKMKGVQIDGETKITEEGLDSAVVLNLFPDISVDYRRKVLVVTGWEKEGLSSVRCSLCLRSICLDRSMCPSSSHYSWCPSLDLHDPVDIPQWRVVLDTVSHKTTSLQESLSMARRTLNSSISSSSLSLSTE